MRKRIIKKQEIKKDLKPKSGFGKFIEKVKWAFVELIKVYSSQPSYFSKKRLESGIGFVIAEWGMIFWLIRKIEVMDTYDFAIWASMQFLVAGYMVKQIQKQKEFDTAVEELREDESYEEPESYEDDTKEETTSEGK